MNLAATIIRDVSAAGGIITAQDGRIKLSAPAPLPPALLERVREAKPVLLATLEPHTWTANDWQAFYHERAGIVEHDGGLPRTDAERRAYEHCVVRWMSLNPPGGHLLLSCKSSDFGGESRRREAIKALALMGVNY